MRSPILSNLICVLSKLFIKLRSISKTCSTILSIHAPYTASNSIPIIHPPSFHPWCNHCSHLSHQLEYNMHHSQYFPSPLSQPKADSWLPLAQFLKTVYPECSSTTHISPTMYSLD